MPQLYISGLPGIADVPEFLRVLSALGLTLFLVLLRFDAERFNAAEYDDHGLEFAGQFQQPAGI